MTKHLLYLHGFNSSSQSEKAILTKQYINDKNIDVIFHCPQISSSPLAAIAQCEAILASEPNEQWGLMGSSLGGYFATYLAEKYGYSAVLINPAVKPFELLHDYIGVQKNPYTGEVYDVTEQHMHELHDLYHKKISINRYMMMVQTGDEVLDYRQAVEKYQGNRIIVQANGDHSFVNYQKMLPEIMVFLSLQ
ncbi:YqiA/YcfP family alpha/beta fold hydrolase [Thalassotalea sp. 1_MG-2023]|uniref:YqiA/YcfP family alpha/beta fold hydrolase n=1 Tax=Thalassotalea sp. 1_MG-2023 TaxID=3062680 RepID=UPI0026E20B10|nr:YqiA/YcfP family alpha/beta fold hydrolase [Thalassotalea sp. 1_MG-2023]MDO6428057.1 YqiA/YcfP family alpha/beta fold hydrolase [Thalassotalea sp. 1_MG-2023]